MESIGMLLNACVIGIGLGYGLMLGVGLFKVMSDACDRLVDMVFDKTKGK